MNKCAMRSPLVVLFPTRNKAHAETSLEEFMFIGSKFDSKSSRVKWVGCLPSHFPFSFSFDFFS